MKSLTRNLLLIISACALLLSGCTIVNPVVPETGHYYINPDSQFGQIAKVAFIELDNYSDYPGQTRDVTEATVQALQKKHLFNIRIIRKSDPDYIDLQLDRDKFTYDELSEMRTKLRTDAIIFGAITDYTPYPHMSVGLNMKMLDIKNGYLIWGVEQFWDSTDYNLQKRMKLFHNTNNRDGYNPLGWELIMTSPRAFNKFVSHEIAQTLPNASQYMKLRLSSNKVTIRPKPPTQYKEIRPLPKTPIKLEPMPKKPIKLVPMPAPEQLSGL